MSEKRGRPLERKFLVNGFFLVPVRKVYAADSPEEAVKKTKEFASNLKVLPGHFLKKRVLVKEVPEGTKCI